MEVDFEGLLLVIACVMLLDVSGVLSWYQLLMVFA
jgi:hypothetical protein